MNPKAADGKLALAFNQRPAPNSGTAASQLTAIWLAIDIALRGVIGPQGVAALYSRSLGLTARCHPWMAVACGSQAAGMDLAVLESEMVQQPLAEARDSAATLLQVFEDLLASLIGSALAERLLRPVWDVTPGEAPVEEIEPS